MERRRKHFPLRYRRARSLLYVIGLFWLWLWLGSAALMAGLYHSPVHAALAIYAIAVVVLVSIPAALLAAIRMVMNRPHPSAAVVPLRRRSQQPLEPADWWYDERVS